MYCVSTWHTQSPAHRLIWYKHQHKRFCTLTGTTNAQVNCRSSSSMWETAYAFIHTDHMNIIHAVVGSITTVRSLWFSPICWSPNSCGKSFLNMTASNFCYTKIKREKNHYCMDRLIDQTPQTKNATVAAKEKMVTFSFCSTPLRWHCKVHANHSIGPGDEATVNGIVETTCI